MHNLFLNGVLTYTPVNIILFWKLLTGTFLFNGGWIHKFTGWIAEWRLFPSFNSSWIAETWQTVESPRVRREEVPSAVETVRNTGTTRRDAYFNKISLPIRWRRRNSYLRKKKQTEKWTKRRSRKSSISGLNSWTNVSSCQRAKWRRYVKR